MKGVVRFTGGLAAVVALALAITQNARAAPFVVNTNLQLRPVLSTADPSGARAIRIARDPRNNQLYYSKFNGDIHRVTLAFPPGTSTAAKVYGAADHGISDSAQGMAIGPDGTIYVVGNTATDAGNRTFARIVKGVPDAGGPRTWSLLAQTEPLSTTCLTALSSVPMATGFS